MNVERVWEILRETTSEYRKGAAIEERVAGSLAVTEVYAMPPVAEAPVGRKLVDVEFMVIAVDEAAAQRRRADLIGELDAYPYPDRLAGGPSYIEVGAELGDQGAALCLFALGEALGLWTVITPSGLGFEGEAARDLAGRGLVMITGYARKAAA